MSILIDQDTTFIIQGITGREAVNLTRECLDYGSKIVGGVTPGRKGREVHGVPVFDTVEQVVEHNGGVVPDGSVVTVPPAGTRDAVFEALHAGIKTIVIVTERIPRRDVAMMVELADAKGARIIGPNCLGVIVPGVAKMGGIGGPARNAAVAYQPGAVGVMSRSGGMTTEISSTLTAAGLGVSTAVSIGGDAIIGSTYAELMPYFEADEQTQAIVIYTEPGGRMEAQLAQWVKDNDSRLPIIAFMAGKFMDDEEMQGMSFGHAGTIVEGKEDSATEKIARLEAAGIPGRAADRRDSRPRQGQARRAERSMRADALFIAVEVDDQPPPTPSSRASSPRPARSTSSPRSPTAPGDRRAESRRVRPLPAVPRRRGRGRGEGDQALRQQRRPRLRTGGRASCSPAGSACPILYAGGPTEHERKFLTHRNVPVSARVACIPGAAAHLVPLEASGAQPTSDARRGPCACAGAPGASRRR